MVSGVPVEGEAGIGYMLKKGFDLPPLMFTSEEIAYLLQLSADQTSGALRAIGQIMSKGKVQAEELRGQILAEMGLPSVGASRATLTKLIKRDIQELVLAKKIKPALVIDEASLLRLDVFQELHTLTQFEGDSKPYLSIILAGQSHLIDKLSYRTSQPLASRIVARSHLEGVNRQDMEHYIRHHLAIAGVKKNPFDPAALTAIHQGSGGLFRKANHLARGALIAAARQQCATVSADHVRLASTELF